MNYFEIYKNYFLSSEILFLKKPSQELRSIAEPVAPRIKSSTSHILYCGESWILRVFTAVEESFLLSQFKLNIFLGG